MKKKTVVVDGITADESVVNINWAIIKSQYAISPIYGGNGRVLVQEDPFKSRFDCGTCAGKQHNGIPCPRCKGTKEYKGDLCWECSAPSELGGSRPLGYIPCTVCNGKGGTIIIPDDSKKNATTGNILAVSENDILHVKIGNKVMFTSWSGSPFNFLGLDLRVIIEKDLLCLVKSLKVNTDSINEGSFAELANMGVPRQ